MSDLAASSQVVEVEGLSKALEKNRGVLTLHTDHPAQAKVELPFLILD